jgi:hypothetical protein
MTAMAYLTVVCRHSPYQTEGGFDTPSITCNPADSNPIPPVHYTTPRKHSRSVRYEGAGNIYD